MRVVAADASVQPDDLADAEVVGLMACCIGLYFTIAAVVMGGTVTEGYLLGARVHQTGQLVDAATSRFTGSITVFPATQG